MDDTTYWIGHAQAALCAAAPQGRQCFFRTALGSCAKGALGSAREAVA